LPLDDRTLPNYLRDAGLISDPRDARVEPAGDGNINYVRRVRLADGTSLVVKHARATLERFPEYAAPPERLVFEHRYGELARSRLPELAGILPDVIRFDAELPALLMEDIADAPRLEDALLGGRATDEALAHAVGELGRFLGALHRATRADARELAPSFANGQMQELHGEHIFTLPYQPNDFPVPKTVRAHGERALARPGVRDAIADLRHSYYDAREGLVHGDVQGGNLLLQGKRLRLLDAEIAHVGDPAFDLGCAWAHLRFHALLPAPAHGTGVEKLEAALLGGYLEGGGDPRVEPRARRYAGVEMLRRTLGAARPPFLEDPEVGVRVIDGALGMLV
jgi:5-methylthioribose kinase